MLKGEVLYVCNDLSLGVTHNSCTCVTNLGVNKVITLINVEGRRGEVGGWGRDPKICMGRHWGMGSSTI